MRRPRVTPEELRARLSRARQLLHDHHADVEPDAGFAARVAARVPDRRPELLGRAALQLLPATLALVGVLAWFLMSRPATPAGVVETAAAPSEDVLSWLLEDGEVLP